MFNKIIIVLVWIVIGIATIWVGGFIITRNNIKKQSANIIESSTLGVFAKCLADSGVKMYGASWCSHCQNQKKLFGESFNEIEYIECADPANSNKQAQTCTDADITGYPTWIFADGQRLAGELTLQSLSEKSGCEYNQQ